MPRFSVLSLALLLGSAVPVGAQIPVAEYAARRDTVAVRLGDGVLLSFGAGEPMTDEADFHQLPGFEYLTGYDRMNAVFVMGVRGGRVTYQMLFEPPIDPAKNAACQAAFPDGN